jgi:hypothetical protein
MGASKRAGAGTEDAHLRVRFYWIEPKPPNPSQLHVILRWLGLGG